VALLASAAVGAPERAWSPEACGGTARIGDSTPGTWYRIDPVLGGGARTGQRLVIRASGAAGTRAMALDAESFAAGPFGGTVLVGTDDAGRSRLSLVDVAQGCAWPLGGSTDVIRTATLAPDGATVFEHRVDRRTRADLGIWHRPLDGSTPATRLLPPIVADARFGPTWLTDLAWSEDGRSLVVQSCGEVACRFRVLDPLGGAVRHVSDPGLGDLVGLSGDRLVAHGACRGLPCPLLSVDLRDDAIVILDPVAGQAVLSLDEQGRPVVVHEVGAAGDHLRVVELDGRAPQVIPGDPDGRRLVPGAARSAGATERVPGWVLFGPDGRLPVDGSVRPVFRHVPDGRTVPLDEVSR
jgi:hypothetical protein